MFGTLRTYWRTIAAGVGIGGTTLVVIGVPTAVIANPWFTRMTPTRPQDYIFLGITVLLAAVLGATYTLPAGCSLQGGKLTAGGFLSFLAVGCPICNKVVVLLLGVSGALAYFEPFQPVLALGSLLLLGYAVFLRLRAVRAARRGLRGSFTPRPVP